MPSSGWCIWLHKEKQAVDVLPPIQHGFLVHIKGMASQWHKQNNRILFIQASEPPSCGTIFGENCKTTNTPSGLSMLSSEEPHAMYVLPIIPHAVLSVHGQGLTSLCHNQYTGIWFIQATEHPSFGTRFGGKCKTMMSSLGWCMLLLLYKQLLMELWSLLVLTIPMM